MVEGIGLKCSKLKSTISLESSQGDFASITRFLSSKYLIGSLSVNVGGDRSLYRCIIFVFLFSVSCISIQDELHLTLQTLCLKVPI